MLSSWVYIVTTVGSFVVKELRERSLLLLTNSKKILSVKWIYQVVYVLFLVHLLTRFYYLVCKHVSSHDSVRKWTVGRCSERSIFPSYLYWVGS